MPRKPSLSRHLRDARIKRRLSVAEVAEQVGVSQSSIYFWETDHCRPRDREPERIVQGAEAAGQGDAGDGRLGRWRLRLSQSNETEAFEGFFVSSAGISATVDPIMFIKMTGKASLSGSLAGGAGRASGDPHSARNERSPNDRSLR